MDNIRFSRTAGLVMILGALLGLGGGIREAMLPTTWGSAQFLAMQGLFISAHALVLVGLIGLARSGAAGAGRLAKVGLGLALLASAMFIPLEVFVIGNQQLGGMLLGLCVMVHAVGMVLAGIAVLRAGRWGGWHRFMPLLSGLYTFLILIPSIVLTGDFNHWVLAGWEIPVVLLGIALYQQGLPRTTSPNTVGV